MRGTGNRSWPRSSVTRPSTNAYMTSWGPGTLRVKYTSKSAAREVKGRPVRGSRPRWTNSSSSWVSWSRSSVTWLSSRMIRT
jgi:hypothetical protein